MALEGRHAGRGYVQVLMMVLHLLAGGADVRYSAEAYNTAMSPGCVLCWRCAVLCSAMFTVNHFRDWATAGAACHSKCVWLVGVLRGVCACCCCYGDCVGVCHPCPCQIRVRVECACTTFREPQAITVLHAMQGNGSVFCIFCVVKHSGRVELR